MVGLGKSRPTYLRHNDEASLKRFLIQLDWLERGGRLPCRDGATVWRGGLILRYWLSHDVQLHPSCLRSYPRRLARERHSRPGPARPASCSVNGRCTKNWNIRTAPSPTSNGAEFGQLVEDTVQQIESARFLPPQRRPLSAESLYKLSLCLGPSASGQPDLVESALVRRSGDDRGFRSFSTSCWKDSFGSSRALCNQ